MVLGTFFLMCCLMATAMPVAFALILSSSAYYWIQEVSLQIIPQKIAHSVESFPLLAIPLFILTGELMNTTSITDRLVRFAMVLVGRFTGGLGNVVVVTNMIMGGISGSAMADASGTGIVLVPAMSKRGYSPAYAAAIVASASTIGSLVPPSIPAVVYGALAEVSTSRVFLGGIVPGVLMGLYLMGANYVMARRRGYPREQAPTRRDVARACLAAIPAMGMPLIIVGGIVFGVFTPTEAAGVAVCYALVLGGVIYQELTWRKLWGVARRVSVTVSAIMFIFGGVALLGDVITREQVQETMTVWALALSHHPLVILLMVNVLLLVMGIVLEPLPLMFLFIPILVPLMQKIGVDTVYFGVVMILNLMLALLHPPIGLIMCVMCAMAKCSMWEFTKEEVPFFVALVLVLLLIIFVPSLVLWLPNLVFGVRAGP